MRDPGDHDRRLPAGPELVSVAVLVLAALLIVTALSYSWIATRERAVLSPAVDSRPATPSLPAGAADRGDLQR